MSTNGASTTRKGRLQGKVCIIIGGGNGFGETMAKAFVKEGAHVVIADVNPTGGRRVEEEIQSARGKDTAVFQQADVTNLASWNKLLERTLEVFGSLKVVVNNTGTTYPKKDSHTVTEDDGTTTAAIVPYFMEKKAGVMLNTSSVGGVRGWYGGTKAFVNKITEALASEYGHSGIRVISFAQFLLTQISQSFMGINDTPENRAKFESSLPLGKALQTESSPSYVTNAAIYLCSDEATFVSGVNLPVDRAATVYALGVGR